jgi:hypothetical protein
MNCTCGAFKVYRAQPYDRAHSDWCDVAAAKKGKGGPYTDLHLTMKQVLAHIQAPLIPPAYTAANPAVPPVTGTAHNAWMNGRYTKSQNQAKQHSAYVVIQQPIVACHETDFVYSQNLCGFDAEWELVDGHRICRLHLMKATGGFFTPAHTAVLGDMIYVGNPVNEPTQYISPNNRPLCGNHNPNTGGLCSNKSFYLAFGSRFCQAHPPSTPANYYWLDGAVNTAHAAKVPLKKRPATGVGMAGGNPAQAASNIWSITGKATP